MHKSGIQVQTITLSGLKTHSIAYQNELQSYLKDTWNVLSVVFA